CQSGVWRSNGGDVPSGTICGYATNGGSLGSWCQGYNPYIGCPPGFTQSIWKAAIGTDQRIAFCARN
ncbi:hypothetical protein, partial [Pseudomonas sp. AAC]|uniref:hypothetical protein n=1 Tax=Pseudomonas sp. AAC TaxID=1502784 RepID=UPI001C4750B6